MNSAVTGDYVGQVSVVVPVKDEADNILPLIEEIHASLAGQADFEIIYVDDGSTDATPQQLALAQQRYSMLRVIRHRRSCGQSTALATGVRARAAPWIATLDGDGQNDPADIPALLAALAPRPARARPGAGGGLARQAQRQLPCASCRRASPTACAAACSATARPTPAAG